MPATRGTRTTPPTRAGTPAAPRPLVVGVGATFGLNGLAVATWFSRVPAARDALGLGSGALGLVLLALSAGSVLAMVTAGAITHRLGTRRTVRLSTGLVAAGLVVTGTAVGALPSVAGAALGLFALGCGTGTCNVAMNVEAAEVERLLDRAVMPRFHGLWSLGTVVAAGAAVFGVFVGAMTLGRVAGAGVLDRWGRVPVVLGGMLLAVAGVVAAVLGGPAVAVAGVALWGLGTSLGFPVGVSAAADDPARAAARVSVVALIGYTAFLAGPPVVGLLGEHVGVLRALLVVPLLLVPALALTPVLRPAGR
ncbi:hypothetical protein ACFV4N_17150 [Actinosynnema sp. NPDC059797]